MPGPTVLVVADEPIFARFLVTLLTEKGYQAHTVPSPAARPVAAQLQPKLIVVDLDLLRAPGVVTIQDLRTDPATAPIPILALAGQPSPWPGSAPTERQRVSVRVILVICSDPDCLQARQTLIHRAGHLSLPAPTVAAAQGLLRKVRLALIITDAVLADGRAPPFIRQLRALDHLAQVIVVVLGVLTAEEQHDLADDPYTYVPPVGTDEGISEVLTPFLGAP